MRIPPLTSAALLAASVAAAPLSTGAHAYPLIKLPNGDYTLPKSALQGSQKVNVTLHAQGLRTIVTVTVFGNGNRKHVLSLRTGTDCVRTGATTMPLNPAITGQPSRTIVSVPISSFTSRDYVVDVRNATTQQQFREACVRI